MQGFNMGRYVPPDLEGTTSGNALHRKKPPGHRHRAPDGTLQQTVRFEMPFAVWCTTCPASAPVIIGQGVRFNAVKTRVGSYHSTPIWSFKMRHAACGGELEVRTDPQNTAYVVSAGGRRRETAGEEGGAARRDASGLVATEDGHGLRILTDREREDMRRSAFKHLERTIEDREQAAQARLRIEEIEDAQVRTWEDPYAANARLRKTFRVGRHEREKAGRAAEDLKDRMSLGIDLLPENEMDAKRAALVDFRPAAGGDGEDDGRKALTKPLFAAGRSASESKGSGKTPDRGSQSNITRTSGNTAIASHKKPRRLKSEIAAAQHKDSLVSEIVGNTRAAKDPFLVAFSSSPASGDARSKTGLRAIAGIKRKQASEKTEASADDTTNSPQSDAKVAKTGDQDQENGTKLEADTGSETAPAGFCDKQTSSLLAALVEYDSD